MSPRIGSLFAGYGGLEMGVQSVLGGEIAWHVENEPAAAKVLAHHWPHVDNLGDVTRVGLPYSDEEWEAMKRRAEDDPDYELPAPDWSEVEPVDVLTGGFPCQDVSAAGRRAGLRPDSRSGLWTHMARAVYVLRPELVIVENVRGLLSAEADCDLEPCPWCVGNGEHRPLRALGAVLGDLAVLGYDTVWCGLRASDVGAPHSRFRIFIAAVDARGIGDGASWATNEEPQWTDRARRAGEHAAADAGHGREPEWTRSTGRAREQRTPEWGEPGHGRAAPAADAESLRRESGGVGLGDAAQQSEPERDRISPWGDYGPAIRRWERIRGLAPAPTRTGRGAPTLAPEFVEWAMGLDAGHVTDVDGLTRTDMLRLLGNGVVPQQASVAVAWLLGHEG